MVNKQAWMKTGKVGKQSQQHQMHARLSTTQCKFRFDLLLSFSFNFTNVFSFSLVLVLSFLEHVMSNRN